MSKPVLEKIQIAAQFSIDTDDGYREPGTFGPVEMTARDWADFDLQAAIEEGLEGHVEAPRPAPNRAKQPA